MEHHHEIQANIDHPAPENSSGLLTINGTLLFIAVSFVVFTIAMQRIFYAPIAEIRTKRREYFSTIKQEANNALTEAEKLEAEYNKKINAARKKVSDNATRVMAEANLEKNKILEEKRQDIALFLGENRAKIREEKTGSLQSLQESVKTYALDISRKVLGEETALAIGEYNE